MPRSGLSLGLAILLPLTDANQGFVMSPDGLEGWRGHHRAVAEPILVDGMTAARHALVIVHFPRRIRSGSITNPDWGRLTRPIATKRVSLLCEYVCPLAADHPQPSG